jgi:GT2 family glycosyltransferase
MKDHPEAGATGPQLLHPDGTKQNSIANFPSLATELLNKRILRWLLPKEFPGKERDYREPLEVDSVIGACMMVRRDTMVQVGLLDEDYFLFLEETDWCYRMKKAGWKVYHLPQAEIYHFQGKGVEIEKKKARVEYYRSRYLFFKKNRGNLQWLMLLVGLLVRLGMGIIFTGLACLFTLFMNRSLRRKFLMNAFLMEWHLRGCPRGMGINPQAQI